MKRYRIIEGGRLDKLLKHKTAIGILTASAIILAGMSAATLAFAAEEPAEPVTVKAVAESQPEVKTEPAAAISAAEVCEEPNTELVSLGEFKITYYCPCSTCCGIWSNPENPTTASGARAVEGITIAVDPDVIPYGTEVVIDGHTYTAQDSGNLIQDNRIDIYCESHEQALLNGVNYFEVFIEGGAEDVQN